MATASEPAATTDSGSRQHWQCQERFNKFIGRSVHKWRPEGTGEDGPSNICSSAVMAAWTTRGNGLQNVQACQNSPNLHSYWHGLVLLLLFGKQKGCGVWLALLQVVTQQHSAKHAASPAAPPAATCTPSIPVLSLSHRSAPGPAAAAACAGPAGLRGQGRSGCRADGTEADLGG